MSVHDHQKVFSNSAEEGSSIEPAARCGTEILRLAAVNQKQYRSLYFANTSGADKSPATPFSQSRAFDPKNNNSGFQDDTYAQLVASAAAEPNPTEAKQLYSKLNDIILDQSFSIPMGPQIITKVAAANVRDIQSNMHAGWLYTTTWLGA